MKIKPFQIMLKFLKQLQNLKNMQKNIKKNLNGSKIKENGDQIERKKSFLKK